MSFHHFSQNSMHRAFFCTLFFAISSTTLLAQTTATRTVPMPCAGTIRHYENFPSQNVIPRNVDIWLPPGYDSAKHSAQRYAVLYMHDGQMLFDSTITWNKQEWRVDEAMTTLLADNAIRPCIVVGVWNTGKTRHSEYFPKRVFSSLPKKMQDSLLKSALQNKAQSDAYLRFLTQELKPFVDSAFATLPDRANTFIAGSSMGGLISMYALSEYPRVFGGAACLSTHWVGNIQWSDSVIPRAFDTYVRKYFPKPSAKGFTHTIYFDYGTATLDSLYKPHQIRIDRTMKRKGYTEKNWITREFVGADHTERSWAKRLAIPLQFLLGVPKKSTRSFRH